MNEVETRITCTKCGADITETPFRHQCGLGVARNRQSHYNKEYYQENKEEIAKVKRLYRAGVRREVINMLGCKCKECSFTDHRALSVMGNPRGKIAYVTWYNDMYHQLKSGKNPGLYLLCENCRAIMEYRNYHESDLMV